MPIKFIEGEDWQRLDYEPRFLGADIRTGSRLETQMAQSIEHHPEDGIIDSHVQRTGARVDTGLMLIAA